MQTQIHTNTHIYIKKLFMFVFYLTHVVTNLLSMALLHDPHDRWTDHDVRWTVIDVIECESDGGRGGERRHTSVHSYHFNGGHSRVGDMLGLPIQWCDYTDSATAIHQQHSFPLLIQLEVYLLSANL